MFEELDEVIDRNQQELILTYLRTVCLYLIFKQIFLKFIRLFV